MRLGNREVVPVEGEAGENSIDGETQSFPHLPVLEKSWSLLVTTTAREVGPVLHLTRAFIPPLCAWRRIQTRWFIRTSCSSLEEGWGFSGFIQSLEHRSPGIILPISAQALWLFSLPQSPNEGQKALREHLLDGNVQSYVIDVALEVSTERVLENSSSWKGRLDPRPSSFSRDTVITAGYKLAVFLISSLNTSHKPLTGWCSGYTSLNVLNSVIRLIHNRYWGNCFFGFIFSPWGLGAMRNIHLQTC